jgi:hypothetical protein
MRISKRSVLRTTPVLLSAAGFRTGIMCNSGDSLYSWSCTNAPCTRACVRTH